MGEESGHGLAGPSVLWLPLSLSRLPSRGRRGLQSTQGLTAGGSASEVTHSVTADGIQFLMDYWTQSLSSSHLLSQGLLSISCPTAWSVLRAAHNMAAGSSQTSEWEQENKKEATVLGHLNLEQASHHFFYILFVILQWLGPACYTRGSDHTREYQAVEWLGIILVTSCLMAPVGNALSKCM